jgi:hypothetical protein
MTKEKDTKTLNDLILRDIGEAVGALDFGIVTIKVQDSKIIQIEVTKRKRFDEVWKIEDGAGI